MKTKDYIKFALLVVACTAVILVIYCSCKMLHISVKSVFAWMCLLVVTITVPAAITLYYFAKRIYAKNEELEAENQELKKQNSVEEYQKLLNQYELLKREIMFITSCLKGHDQIDNQFFNIIKAIVKLQNKIKNDFL